MHHGRTKDLIRHLIGLSIDVAMGRYGDGGDLFELTKGTVDYPPEITELPESFGMMLVKAQAREFHLKKIIEELKATQAELHPAGKYLSRNRVPCDEREVAVTGVELMMETPEARNLKK
jgi:hypothetical protein